MKKLISLALAIVFVLCLGACGADKTPGDSTDQPSVNASELSYRLGSCTVRYVGAEDTPRSVALTSITLRGDRSICTYLRVDDMKFSPDFPELSAKTLSGDTYYLKPDMITDGTVCFESVPELPVSEIVTITAGDATIDLTSGVATASGDDNGRLNRLSSMSWAELFAYCLGSDGAYSEGAYGELARRMVAEPEEFALRLLTPAYPYPDSAASFLATADILPDFFEAYGFDDALELEICTGICAACLAPNTQKVIETLSGSGDTQLLKVAGILSEALGSIR